MHKTSLTKNSSRVSYDIYVHACFPLTKQSHSSLVGPRALTQ